MIECSLGFALRLPRCFTRKYHHIILRNTLRKLKSYHFFFSVKEMLKSGKLNVLRTKLRLAQTLFPPLRGRHTESLSSLGLRGMCYARPVLVPLVSGCIATGNGITSEERSLPSRIFLEDVSRITQSLKHAHRGSRSGLCREITVSQQRRFAK